MLLSRLRQESDNYKEDQRGQEKLFSITKHGINDLEIETHLNRKLALEDHSIIEDLKKAKEVLERELYRGEANNKKLNEEINIKLKLIKEKENEISAQYKEIE
jgi:hypothetical protein